jgi:hypothetical protein
LVRFAEREFQLNQRQEDGCTLREHLEVLAVRSGTPHELLENAPPLPKQAAHVWRWFCELHVDRIRKGSPPERITATMMQTYEWAAGVELGLWERIAIRRLDRAYLTPRDQTE